METNTCEQLMTQAINFARSYNPIWPFSTIIINQQQQILCQATDCAHISPLFHAESLAIHVLVTQCQAKNLGELTLLTTAEPDPLSLSAIYWANITHDLNIKQIYFGSPFATIQQLWPFGIDLSAQQIINHCSVKDISVHGPILAAECDALFNEAKQQQQKLNKAHPARNKLSTQLEDFYQFMPKPTTRI